MTPTCPKCAAPNPGRYGTRIFRRAALTAEGRIARVEDAAQRFRCPACGHVFSPQSPHRDGVLDAVADAVMKAGVSPAARRFGCDDGTVSAMLAEWLAARDAAVAVANPDLPDVVAATALRVQGRDCLILSDPVDERLLDLAASADLPAWLSRYGAAPCAIAVEFDARIVAGLDGAGLAGATLVAPSVARRAIENAGLVSFRALVRDATAAGRNYRESANLLRKPDAALSAAERDDLKAWQPRLRRFRFAYLALLADLAHAAADRFAETATRVVATLSETAPGCALHRLLERWKGAIVRGIRQRWIDGPLAMARSLRTEIRRLRPTSGFDALRAILLHADDADRGRPGLLDAVATLRTLSPRS